MGEHSLNNELSFRKEVNEALQSFWKTHPCLCSSVSICIYMLSYDCMGYFFHKSEKNYIFPYKYISHSWINIHVIYIYWVYLFKMFKEKSIRPQIRMNGGKYNPVLGPKTSYSSCTGWTSSVLALETDD